MSMARGNAPIAGKQLVNPSNQEDTTVALKGVRTMERSIVRTACQITELWQESSLPSMWSSDATISD